MGLINQRLVLLASSFQKVFQNLFPTICYIYMSAIGFYWHISWVYRLTLKPGHASSTLISNTLSDRFIKVRVANLVSFLPLIHHLPFVSNQAIVLQHFPEMNVSIAFNSLFNAEYSRKYVGSSTLWEITQVGFCPSDIFLLLS